MYYVYVLQSIRRNRLYIGSTNDVQRRLAEHNSGKVRSTKAYRPYTVIHTEKFASKTGARKRESQIKKSGLLRKQFKERARKE